MPVYFANAGLIDLDVIRIMGVSVKTKDNPIGYFGTGLKFALSTLLRTGHKITLLRDIKTYEFTVRDVEIRGSKFQRVYMNDEPLPFTTDLGKNWEVWQAYRELHSNTLDEEGVISNEAKTADTVFVVTGGGIEREYHNRDSIFVSGKPIAANEFLEVYEGSTKSIFYRGVRAGTMPEEMLFTYNILTSMTLTEDRTFESQFTVEWKLAQLLPKLRNKGIVSQLLDGTDKWDQSLNFTTCGSPSDEFLEAAKERYADMSSNHAAKKMVDRDVQDKGTFKPAKMLDLDQDKYLQSFEVLGKLGCSLSPEDVEIVESLGPTHMGMYHLERDQIFLAKSTLDHGIDVIASTLYEEWLHKDYKYRDESRELQTFLFQRLTALAAGMELPEPEDQSHPLF